MGRAVERPREILVGREAELARLDAAVASGAALVGVHGVGGCGKSALVRAFCAASARCLVADVHDASGLDEAWARILESAGVGGRGGPDDDAESTLRLALEAADATALVLDGADAVLDAAGRLAALVQRAGGDTTLVTSRHRLAEPGAARVEVGPLATPATEAELDTAPASRLWLAHAARLSPGRVLSEAERADLVAILAAIDGLPLAIELAVRREHLVGTASLRARLELAGASATLDAVGRAFDATWAALDPAARRALADLSVFRGRFPLELAEAVLGAREPPVVELVEVLSAFSCLRVEALPSGARVLRLLRLIREQVGARMPAHPDAALSERHARVVVERAEQTSGASLTTTGSRRRALAPYVPELEAAFDFAIAAGHLELAARALLALDRVRWSGGPSRPHLARLADLAPHADALDAALASALFETQARWRARQGALETDALDRAERLAREAAAPDRLAAALRTRAHALSQVGRPSEALAAIDAALREARDPALRASCLRVRATLLRRAGEAELADEAYRSAHDAHAAIPDDEGRGATLAEWSMHLLEMGRRAEAEVARDRARPLLAAEEPSYLSAYLDAEWAMQAHVEGDLEAAVALHRVATAAALACGAVTLVRISRAYAALAGFERGDVAAAGALEALDALGPALAVPFRAMLGAIFAFLLATREQAELAERERARAAAAALPPSNFRHAVRLLDEATTLALDVAAGGGAPDARARVEALAAAEPTAARAGDGAAGRRATCGWPRA
ncbi:MAG: hypothetical protein KF729_02255 [Sandaracinaceae bacterium]|nr:hypothetical protein [Sandaracinaceae bacterium]